MGDCKKATNRLKKVMVWRICSIVVTLLTIWMVQGNISEATTLTVILHLFLIICHWAFEWIWEDVLPTELNR